MSDTWQTPQWLFDKLSKEQGPFDIDLCATRENSKCENYCLDYLNNIDCSLNDPDETFKYNLDIYLKETCSCAFMNPPYSNPLPFVEKAWEDSKHCKIVLLLKVDPSTKWWSVFWEYGERVRCDDEPWEINYYHGPKPGCTVQFLPKRVQFDPPQLSGPSFASCVVIFDRREI